MSTLFTSSKIKEIVNTLSSFDFITYVNENGYEFCEETELTLNDVGTDDRFGVGDVDFVKKIHASLMEDKDFKGLSKIHISVDRTNAYPDGTASYSIDISYEEEK